MNATHPATLLAVALVAGVAHRMEHDAVLEVRRDVLLGFGRYRRTWRRRSRNAGTTLTLVAAGLLVAYAAMAARREVQRIADELDRSAPVPPVGAVA
jgi:hypothetical protein